MDWAQKLPINWGLISNPFNWAIILLMVLIAGFAAQSASQLLKQKEA